MAGIDHSIYFQQQAPDFLGNIQKGLSMREMIDNRALRQKQIEEDDGVKQAYKAGIIQNPDGTTSFDNAKTFSEMVKVNPQKAIAFQSDYQQKDADAKKRKYEVFNQKVDFLGRAVSGIKDQNSYVAAMNEAKGLGLDTSTMPSQWGPDAQQKLNFYAGQAYTMKDKMDQMYKEQDIGLKKSSQDIDRDRLKLEREKAYLESQRKAASGDNLPIDQRKYVEGLSTKNANKVAIKNQIDAVIGNWDKLSDDQKVATGRSLLKTLNSTEGADAIGAEEAKRLGSKLEFAMGNFTNSNPTQFGRDLEGFKEQAMNTSAGINDAVRANQAEIDAAMGRAPKQASNTQKTPVFKTSEIEW